MTEVTLDDIVRDGRYQDFTWCVAPASDDADSRGERVVFSFTLFAIHLVLSSLWDLSNLWSSASSSMFMVPFSL